MNRAERRAQKYRSPAAHLRFTQTVVQVSAPKIVVMRNATSEPMQALKDWINTYDDPDEPAMSAQMLAELCGVWLGFTRGLWLNGTPWPRDEERHGNNLMSRLFSGAVLSRADLVGLYEMLGRLINASIKVEGWGVWAEAASDLGIKNEFARRQSDDYWIGGWKHKDASE